MACSFGYSGLCCLACKSSKSVLSVIVNSTRSTCESVIVELKFFFTKLLKSLNGISGNGVLPPLAATLGIKKSVIINQMTWQLVERMIHKMESI